jgi:hypothetical protein
MTALARMCAVALSMWEKETNVPVLSVAITVQLPSVSTLCSSEQQTRNSSSSQKG